MNSTNYLTWCVYPKDRGEGRTTHKGKKKAEDTEPGKIKGKKAGKTGGTTGGSHTVGEFWRKEGVQKGKGDRGTSKEKGKRQKRQAATTMAGTLTHGAEKTQVPHTKSLKRIGVADTTNLGGVKPNLNRRPKDG